MFITLKETKICLIMPVLLLICYVCSWQNLLSPHIFDDSAGKESACNVGDLGLIPGLVRCPGQGKGYPLQYSGLENSVDFIVHGVAKSQTQLSEFHFDFWHIFLFFSVTMRVNKMDVKTQNE